ncbi:uncharacterized protein LOC126335323 [Schistocerca gregaria]|uniref:uncharacterized protein LOC126335323 n=1 Tax=Schistocerca gregaria TaxID=7010 RepID=UPI00211DA719|nr:uncharacterized protein LOC126335323 [Schistocerca gregaria]
MVDIKIDDRGIEKQLTSLKRGKAAGPDGIPVQFYTEYAKELAPLLAAVYRRSLEERSIPKDWKRAQVVPVFKKGRRTDVQNYRPISLTSISCRILEHVLRSSIMSFLETRNLLVGKADARLRFIGRILRKCNPTTKEVGYSTLVRPMLEYGSAVWDPHQVGLIEEIEKIQRRAAHFVTGSFSNCESVTEMIDKLQWKTLQERRSVARYGLLLKFGEHTFTEESSSILLPPTYISRRDHEDKIREIRAHTEAYR